MRWMEVIWRSNIQRLEPISIGDAIRQRVDRREHIRAIMASYFALVSSPPSREFPMTLLRNALRAQGLGV